MTAPHSGPQPYRPGHPAPGHAPAQPYGQVPGVPPVEYIPPHVGVPAEWGTRVLGHLLDGALASLVVVGLGAVAAVIMLVAVSTGDEMTMLFTGFFLYFGLFFLGMAGVYAVHLWNLAYRRGTYGQTVGQRVMKIKTVSEETGYVLGFGNAFLRELCHMVDGMACYLGYLFPLWDSKKQTFADKITKTAVVHVDSGQPLPPSRKDRQRATGGLPGQQAPGYPPPPAW